MCGIAGIIGSENEILMQRMLASQQHRGPDNTSIWKEQNIQLGHNRLAIIDLSEEANQPFEDEHYVLVFNGEIYNYIELKLRLEREYQFTTNSDTEILIKAYQKWGRNCVHKLNGMFAFAIWDKKKQTLFAARDRFGVKPLYYTVENEVLYFASEIKALFAAGMPKEPNKKVWANYFMHGSYGLPNETFWKNIHELPGSHCLEYTQKQMLIEKWYVFEKEVQKYFDKNTSYVDVKEHYTALLKDSIKLRFRADVPIGFNLSGGVDSSTLLALVNDQDNSDDIKAFTFYTNDVRYDELTWVEKMITLTKNPLEKVLLKQEEVEDLSRKISFHQDEPFGGIPTLAYAKIFKKAKENNVTVLLDGQGMDEQWAGYDYYALTANNNTIQGVTESPFKINVLSEDLKGYGGKLDYPKHFKDELLNKQYRDLFYTKIPRALRFNDRVSMGFSTELREPFLDYRLVEFAFAQPKKFKISEGVQKKMIRDIATEYLGKQISYAPKRALQTPQREWLGTELKEFVEKQLIKIKESKYANWFSMDEMEKEMKKYVNGHRDSSFHIWQWVNFSLLIDE